MTHIHAGLADQAPLDGPLRGPHRACHRRALPTRGELCVGARLVVDGVGPWQSTAACIVRLAAGPSRVPRSVGEGREENEKAAEVRRNQLSDDARTVQTRRGCLRRCVGVADCSRRETRPRKHGISPAGGSPPLNESFGEYSPPAMSGRCDIWTTTHSRLDHLCLECSTSSQ